MSQHNIQTGELLQEQKQSQSLTRIQILAARLTEMPLEALLQRVETECLENPFLERSLPENSDEGFAAAGQDDGYAQDGDAQRDDALNDYRTEEDTPDYLLHPQNGGESTATMEYAETVSFYDHLKEQMGEYDLTPVQEKQMEYLIGSLEDSGLLSKSLYQIAEELTIYHDVDTTEEDMLHLLKLLWQFDPAGVGARSTQECLLLQIRRDVHNPHREAMLQVVDKMYDLFIRKRWDTIQQRLHLNDTEVEVLRENIRRLNPYPGTSLNESNTMGSRTITPDFIVETDEEGHIQLTLNEGDMPTLKLSQDIGNALSVYEGLKPSELSKSAREEMSFYRYYAEYGQTFISALAQRRENLMKTMAAIVQLQRRFFLEGDEAVLRPMKLDDVAQLAGLDISTVSRVNNEKYVQTEYGTFSLRWFFNRGSASLDGEEISVRKVKVALREIVGSEDKRKPLSDDRLTEALRAKGFDIARRTVAKYREQMGIPVARLRH